MSSELIEGLNEILRQKNEYIIPENIKKDIQIFNVTGTLEEGKSSIKLFTSMQEMNNDPDMSIGDQAIVYGMTETSWEETTKSSKMKFVSPVTLAEAVSTSINCNFTAQDSSHMFSGRLIINSRNFTFSIYTDDANYSIKYTSSDGITYTKTQGPDNIDIGFDIYCEYGWNNIIGNFIKTSLKSFNGFFEAKMIDDILRFVDISTLSINGSEATFTDYLNTTYETTKVFELFNKIQRIEKVDSACMCIINGNMTFYTYKYSSNKEQSPEGLDISGNILLSYNSTFSTSYKAYKYDCNLSTMTYTKTELSVDTSNVITITENNYKYVKIPISNLESTNYRISSTSISSLPVINTSISLDSLATILNLDIYISHLYYVMVDSQLNVTNSNQLLPNFTALGKESVITGDGSLYNNLNINDVKSYLLNIDNISQDCKNLNSTTFYGKTLPESKIYSFTDGIDNNSIYDIIASYSNSMRIPYEGTTNTAKLNCHAITKYGDTYYVVCGSGNTTDKTFYINSFKLSGDTYTDLEIHTFTSSAYINFPCNITCDGTNVIIASSSSSKPYVVKYSLSSKTCTYIASNSSLQTYISLDINPATNTAFYASSTDIIAFNYNTNTTTNLYSSLATRQYEKQTNTCKDILPVVDKDNLILINKNNNTVTVKAYSPSIHVTNQRNLTSFENSKYIFVVGQKGILRYNKSTEAITVNTNVNDGISVNYNFELGGSAGRSYFNSWKVAGEDYIYFFIHTQYTVSTSSNNSAVILQLDPETLEFRKVDGCSTNLILPELDSNYELSTNKYTLYNLNGKSDSGNNVGRNNKIIGSICDFSKGIIPCFVSNTIGDRMDSFTVNATINHINRLFNK